MTASKNLLSAAVPPATSSLAQAIDFDGTNDYLSRASDLTGNADGKTFTFSAWVWMGESGSDEYYVSLANGYFQVGISNTGKFEIFAKNPSNLTALNASSNAAGYFPLNTFVHVCVSVNLADVAQRSVYINDQLVTTTWTSYETTYDIDFTRTPHRIAYDVTRGYTKGRLSNVFLDYTYRDLSVTANRRLFVTADLKPAADQAALNPILYLPMSDPTTVGTNAGTGGDFTLNGTIARSGRGPNQYNAPYSDLDGTADYLSRTTAPTGIADGKQFTLNFVMQLDTVSASCNVLWFGSSTTDKLTVQATSAGYLNITAYDTTATLNFQVTTLSVYTFVVGRNYVINCSVDLTDTNKRHLIINGETISANWNTYINADFDFAITATPKYFIGLRNASGYFNGRLGALWFNTSYIDLSQPANLAKFVTGTGIDAKPVDLGANGELPTGTSPLIYLPMYGNNAGKNYGTGGDFTVNSGPYTGARGPNEYWAASVNSANNSNYMIGANSISSKTITLVLSLKSNTDGNNEHIYFSSTSNGTDRGSVKQLFGTQALEIDLYNSSGVKIVDTNAAGVLSSSQWRTILFSVDMTNSSKRHLYVNGSSPSTTWGAYVDDFISFDYVNLFTGTGNDGTNQLAVVYCADSYIDFSQEANRLKFVDAFGYYTDLASKIESEDIPVPIVYMKFDASALGANAGTGGDFSITGTITPAGYATPT